MRATLWNIIENSTIALTCKDMLIDFILERDRAIAELYCARRSVCATAKAIRVDTVHILRLFSTCVLFVAQDCSVPLSSFHLFIKHFCLRCHRLHCELCVCSLLRILWYEGTRSSQMMATLQSLCRPVRQYRTSRR